LGFAGRTSHVKFAIKPRKNNLFKSLPTNIQTIGDAIRVARQAKNLRLSHVAAKMGIAAALVCTWEDGACRPNNWQIELLAEILEVNKATLAD
jgi:ribosome-binding protein aMBF1 (putative translation factor)